jgi:hypothetical protein
MRGVGDSAPPVSRTWSATTETTTSYVSGVAIGGNLTSSAAATGRAKFIEHIIMLCRFPQDSTMVECIDQKQWDKLEHVVTIDLEEFNDVHFVRCDGFTIKARPLKTHLRMLKCCLLNFKRYNRSYYGICTEDDVLTSTKGVFDAYCRSDDYAKDNAATLATAGLKPPPGSGGDSGNAGAGGTGVVGGAGGLMTAQEFRQGVKQDKARYKDFRMTSISTPGIVVLLQQLACITHTWYRMKNMSQT